MQTRSKVRTYTASTPGGSAASGETGRAQRSPSPDWEINSQDFAGSPSREDSAGPPEKEQSPFVPSHASSPSHPSPPQSRDPEEPDSDDAITQVMRNTQAQNARSPPWLAWQDRALFQEAERLRPFNAARGDAARNAWDALAVELLKNSSAIGSAINRTGAACRARFQKLVKAHKVLERPFHCIAHALSLRKGRPDPITAENWYG
jgi:hypothetical protein